MNKQAILKSELEADPLGLGYATLEDSEVATLLNALSRPGKRDVPSSDVRMYVLLNGLWLRIKSVADTSSDEVLKGTASTILETLGAGSFDTIRMTRPDVAAGVSQMLQVMVSAGAITPEHRAAMIAMGDTLISRADELGIAPVTHIDVGTVRQMTAGDQNA